MIRIARSMQLNISRILPGALLRCGVGLLFLSISASAQVPTAVRDISVNEAAGMVGQYRGSVVLFHIYASWSELSKRELSDINRLGSTYAPRGLVVLAFSADQDRDLLAKFLGNNPLSFAPLRLTATSSQEIAAAIGSFGGTFEGSIPYTGLFDRSGALAYQWIGGHGFSVYSQAIETVLAGSRGPETPSTGSGPPPLRGATTPAGVGFAVQDHPRFKLARKQSNLYTFTRDGKVSEKLTADPVFLAGSVYPRSPITDRKKFAEERLKSTGGLAGIAVTESGEITIDKLSGYELVAEGRDTDLNVPVVVYQAILFSDSRYYLMQGFTPPAEKASNLPAFREMARSFRRQ